MRQRIPLGKLLVEAGLLSEQEVLAALQDQKKSGLRLGQFLIRSRLCREEDIVSAISRQLNISRYSPQHYELDLKVAQRLPKQLAQDHKAVPLRYVGHVLYVAMPDPLDIAALDKLEAVTNCEIEPVICTEQEFNELTSSVYGMFTNLGGVVDSMGDSQNTEEQGAPARQEVALGIQEENTEEMAPVIRLVNSILMQAIRDRVSDIHISPEKESMQIRFRIDGQLRETPSPPKAMAAAMASRLKILGDMDIAVTRVPQDGRFTINMDNREINVRVSSIPTIYGENIVMRLLDMSGQTLTLGQLGMGNHDYKRVQDIVHKPYGMILATGPTGSGKSSSLYAILKEIARPEINVITLEDPVEYRLPGIRQVQLNRRAGMTFADGLRSILRQDPDVIMVGEIRDRETASIAVEAALTGHMVLSTLHTNDASGAATRLIDMGIEPFLVSSVLLCAFAQRLVRRVCPHCAQPYEPSPDALALFNIDPAEGKDGRATFLKGTGCNLCKDTGYRGRTGVFEVLPTVVEVQELINKRRAAAEIAAKAREVGVLHMLNEDAAEKIRKGITTVEAAAASVMV